MSCLPSHVTSWMQRTMDCGKRLAGPKTERKHFSHYQNSWWNDWHVSVIAGLYLYCTSGTSASLHVRTMLCFMCPVTRLGRSTKIWLPRGYPSARRKAKLLFMHCVQVLLHWPLSAGANHKEAQQLARHSTPELTANIYGITRNERLNRCHS